MANKKDPRCTCHPVRGIHAIFCPAKNNREDRRAEYKNKAERTVFYLPDTAKGLEALALMRSHLNKQWWTLRTKNRGTKYDPWGTCLVADRTHLAIYLDKITTPEQDNQRSAEWRQRWQDQKDANYHRTYCEQKIKDAINAVSAEAEIQTAEAADIARHEVLSLSLFALLRAWWMHRKAAQ